MTSLEIILVSVLMTALLFVVAVACGKIIYRVMHAIYNHIKKNYGLRESL